MARELLKSGKHNITAIPRVDSQSKLADGVNIKHIDYDKHGTIVGVLHGRNVRIITLSIPAHHSESKFVQEACGTGVPWIIPNDWSPDTADESLVRDVPYRLYSWRRK
ncbi:hypothetical protein DOTSEDRAFT_22201 [Dothistroma septosporum NZE10]|uniref:NmrA-like domain-containing protein n=1 Tax=Dothistroma septosporum (strain NZE10 / CBS 128990) TaxID=675120 RepID=N1PRS6_DOTSN|nr:hypothetical protein DOTSEDRAFT_22201 [Dothistroma septosporum NZE10]